LTMSIKIYHGYNEIVRTPKFGAGRPYNDFGLGFYCSEYPGYAAEWAVAPGRNGFVSAYSMDPSGLRVVNLCGPQYNALHWLYVLLNYREFDAAVPLSSRAREYINQYFPVDYQGCDVIIGYRADNSCFTFARDFLSDRISYRSLSDCLSASPANREYVLKSNRAFERVTYTGYEVALAGKCYPAAAARELRALRTVRPSDGARDLFISDLIREEVKPYDTRLR